MAAQVCSCVAPSGKGAALMGCSGGSAVSTPSGLEVGPVADGSAFLSSEFDAPGVALSGVTLSGVTLSGVTLSGVALSGVALSR